MKKEHTKVYVFEYIFLIKQVVDIYVLRYMFKGQKQKSRPKYIFTMVTKFSRRKKIES